MVVLGRGAVSYERGTPVAAAARFGMTLEPLPSHAHEPPEPGDTVPCKMGQSREFSPVKGYLGYKNTPARGLVGWSFLKLRKPRAKPVS